MTTPEQSGGSRLPLMIIAWAWVILPFCYGVYELILKIKPLFTG